MTKLGEWWGSKGGTGGGRFKDASHYSLDGKEHHQTRKSFIADEVGFYCPNLTCGIVQKQRAISCTI